MLFDRVNIFKSIWREVDSGMLGNQAGHSSSAPAEYLMHTNIRISMHVEEAKNAELKPEPK